MNLKDDVKIEEKLPNPLKHSLINNNFDMTNFRAIELVLDPNDPNGETLKKLENNEKEILSNEDELVSFYHTGKGRLRMAIVGTYNISQEY